MIKINTIVSDIISKEIEAYTALTNDYMNMSSYAAHIRPIVEKRAKKQVTVNSLVVTLSRLRDELKKKDSLIQNITVTNINSKLPISEVIYENTSKAITELESLHKKIAVARDDFFSATIGTSEIDIICSSRISERVIKHFSMKPKVIIDRLAAVSVSFDKKYFNTPNVIFSLISVLARSYINIAEIVSTYTELIFIVHEKDFGGTVELLSNLRKG